MNGKIECVKNRKWTSKIGECESPVVSFVAGLFHPDKMEKIEKVRERKKQTYAHYSSD